MNRSPAQPQQEIRNRNIARIQSSPSREDQDSDIEQVQVEEVLQPERSNRSMTEESKLHEELDRRRQREDEKEEEKEPRGRSPQNSFRSEEKKKQNLSSGTRSEVKSDSKLFDLTLEMAQERYDEPILPENLAQFEDTAQNVVEEVLVNEILENLAVCFKNCFGEGYKESANEDFPMEDS